MRAIRLYWWGGHAPQSSANFGDTLSYEIVRHISGREVQWAPIRNCELMGIGSIMETVINRNATRSMLKRRFPLNVWGSGCMISENIRIPSYVKLHLVRGQLTRFQVPKEKNNLPIGDPGLITPHIYQMPTAIKSEVGFVPHHSQINSIEVKQLSEKFPKLVIIDPRREPSKVINEICGCELILSSSLHGLIIADSYKIPNIWIQDHPVHKGNQFKFFDYFGSIGRITQKPMKTAEIQKLGLLRQSIETSYFNNITQIQDQIVQSFPHNEFD